MPPGHGPSRPGGRSPSGRAGLRSTARGGVGRGSGAAGPVRVPSIIASTTVSRPAGGSNQKLHFFRAHNPPDRAGRDNPSAGPRPHRSGSGAGPGRPLLRTHGTRRAERLLVRNGRGV